MGVVLHSWKSGSERHFDGPAAVARLEVHVHKIRNAAGRTAADPIEEKNDDPKNLEREQDQPTVRVPVCFQFLHRNNKKG
jgi:hypothetical protein